MGEGDSSPRGKKKQFFLNPLKKKEEKNIFF
jgi:hypothetical protein